MSTYLAAPNTLPGEMSEAARALPICYMHGIYDDVVNLSMGWDAKNRLEVVGLSPEWHEYPMRHEICRPSRATFAAGYWPASAPDCRLTVRQRPASAGRLLHL